MSKSNSTPQHIVDFENRRAKKMEEKRRKYRRILFKKILGVYSVTEDNGIRPIEIVDVSEDGLSFQVPFDVNKPWPSDEKKAIPIRIYFSQDTYIPLVLKIINSRPVLEEKVPTVRYGCVVDQSLKSYQVFLRFVHFLSLYAEEAHSDQGPVSLFYI